MTFSLFFLANALAQTAAAAPPSSSGGSTTSMPGILFGGGAGLLVSLLLKLIDRKFGASEHELDVAVKLRGELHAEATSLREEIRKVQRDGDDWRTKYYDAVSERGSWKLKTEALEDDMSQMKAKVEQLEAELTEALKDNAELHRRVTLCRQIHPPLPPAKHPSEDPGESTRARRLRDARKKGADQL